MNVYKKRAIFTRRNESNVYRMFFWVILILGGIWLIRGVQRGDVKPLFQPTSTPTRLAQSYALEGDAKFISGQLDDIKDADGNVKSTGAITAYREAAKVDPTNAKLMADLARIQIQQTVSADFQPARYVIDIIIHTILYTPCIAGNDVKRNFGEIYFHKS